MVVTLKKSGDSFTFTLPPQAAKDMALVDGSTIDVQPAKDVQPHTIRYATMEEALAVYEQTRPDNDFAYRELAK